MNRPRKPGVLPINTSKAHRCCSSTHGMQIARNPFLPRALRRSRQAAGPLMSTPSTAKRSLRNLACSPVPHATSCDIKHRACGRYGLINQSPQAFAFTFVVLELIDRVVKLGALYEPTRPGCPRRHFDLFAGLQRLCATGGVGSLKREAISSSFIR
jgi:hypothetical protein